MTLSAAEEDAFGPEPLQPGQARRLDCDDETYFADPCETPSLSQSVAHELVSRSPLHAWQMHPRLGGTKRPPTVAKDGGTLIHAVLLGKGHDSLAVIDVDDFRTKAAREQRDEALAAGKTIIKAAVFEEAEKVAAVIAGRLLAFGIDLRKGESEVRIEWREQDGCLCRGMMDNLQIDRATIYDVKTIRSADLHTCQQSIMRYGYDIQGAAYRSAVGKLHPETAGRLTFIDIFVETKPPYAVSPLEHDPGLRALGEDKWQRACQAWVECLRTDRWPGYCAEVGLVTAPAWALWNDEDKDNEDLSALGLGGTP